MLDKVGALDNISLTPIAYKHSTEKFGLGNYVTGLGNYVTGLGKGMTSYLMINTFAHNFFFFNSKT